ncbi:UNVERIFIED_CONTAM: YaaR family protein [Halobacillus marinus]|uniref:YaaR family protein n=1 Tax=unclassified Halobacillus TaxID=2636472 RepID=UPI0002A4F7F8|nr:MULTISPECIES: YaaR family protein [unclassified Halobacillus]ELK48326.1 hypothetical protein D479_03027 [Halobacillus sp. BAB-2008]
MKITQDVRTQVDGAGKQMVPSGKAKSSFHSVIQTKTEQLQQTQLNHLMSTIASQGDRVARSRSFRDLAKYKRLVRDFLKESVSYGYQKKQSHSWNLHGQTRKLTIVETVDEKLVELTEAVMDQESNSIDLLGLIGEIKGLLINLYT